VTPGTLVDKGRYLPVFRKLGEALGVLRLPRVSEAKFCYHSRRAAAGAVAASSDAGFELV
jgi:hypothetical protein